MVRSLKSNKDKRLCEVLGKRVYLAKDYAKFRDLSSPLRFEVQLVNIRCRLSRQNSHGCCNWTDSDRLRPICATECAQQSQLICADFAEHCGAMCVTEII